LNEPVLLEMACFGFVTLLYGSCSLLSKHPDTNSDRNKLHPPDSRHIAPPTFLSSPPLPLSVGPRGSRKMADVA